MQSGWISDFGLEGRIRGVNVIERAIAMLERRKKKRGRLVLVEQRVPLQRQMVQKERARRKRAERGKRKEAMEGGKEKTKNRSSALLPSL